MPHFIAECTDNIREQADLPGLFAKVNEALAATGIFPLGGIRSRAHWLDTWQMADGKHDYAFVHMTLKIGAGRSLESREECYAFFEDLCTVKEISDMAQRLQAAKLLLDGATYEQIVKAVEISTATISRINRCIQYGSGGYRDTIEKVQKSAKPE